ncbi:MAG: DNA polymerase IV [Gammaproteobacteria bacterium]|nr:DNA polymerase IV [Gammaproteobacteria bacterium]
MILHVDMDAFYASVEQRDRPELAGLAVVVGGTPEGRGVVAAASYEARAFGVHSAMPAATARGLCPHAVFVRPRMEYYAQVSAQIRKVFERYTPLIEPLSLDEAFLDVTASERLFGTGRDIAARIKAEIAGELGLVASVGVAPNKFLAKLASDLEKPDGLVVVAPGAEQAFLDPLPVRRLWGVGRVAQAILADLGVHTIGELRRLSPAALQARFGRGGEHLRALAHGIDERAVVPDHGAKSVSHETTFATDITSSELLRAWLLDLTEDVGRRLRRQDLHARTVQIKVRYSDFQTVTRARTRAEPTQRTRDLWQEAERLLVRTLHEAPGRPVRLLGMGASRLSEADPVQGGLFGQAARERQDRLDEAIDRVNERFGEATLRRGRGPRRTD